VTQIRVRPVEDLDRPAVSELVRDLWHADIVVADATVFRPAELPGLLAIDAAEAVAGLLTYRFAAEDTLEVVTINAIRPAGGVGTVLLAAAVELARARGCRRVVLTTTNDNLDALRFY
jgi:GNAT superfamily N-acetyltransferase